MSPIFQFVLPLVLWVVFDAPLANAAPQTTAPPDSLAGDVVAETGGQTLSLPMLKSDYAVRIDGTLATVTVTQSFFNTHPETLNATYLFPLNQKAAVYGLTLQVGEERVEAVIQRKQEAKQTFDAAKAQGKTASLLDQHRPNMFSQNIANLPSGMPVTVTLRYVQTIPKRDGAYELVVPFVVGPRYEGVLPIPVAEQLGLEPRLVSQDAEAPSSPPPLPPLPAQDKPSPEQISGWLVEPLPDFPPVFGQEGSARIDFERVSFALTLHAPTPLHSLTSATHSLAIETTEDGASAALSKGRVIGNRDLVLRYELGIDEAVSAGSSYHADERGGFIALQIEPPKLPATELITPREVVFVLDTSGSMAGEPLSASKTFMRAALEGLRPKDHFRIVRFSDAPEQFASTPLPATPENIRAGLRYVATLSAQGGTEMNRAMRTTFDLPPLPNSLRIVIFLTDGFIGEDRQVIQTVSRRIGDARLYAFGIGTAVNRYLLEGMAKEGRGRARIVGIGEQADAVAKALAQSLDAPLLTDITVDWNGLAVGGQSPARIGDLFAGGGVTVLARTPPIAVPQQIFIKGRVNGRPATLPVDLTLAGSEDAESSAPSSALPVVWARERIFDLERDYTLSGGTDATLKEQITQLGLDFSLQTAFTSFVAVSDVEPGAVVDGTPTVSVAQPMVQGTTAAAYPKLNLSGASGPEPEAVIGLFGVLLLVLARFRNTIRQRLWFLRGLRSAKSDA